MTPPTNRRWPRSGLAASTRTGSGSSSRSWPASGSPPRRSSMPSRIASEAERYLRHPVLGARLLTITSAVAEQLRRGRRLDALMGSQVDAVKLVSSMTLFAAVARRLQEAGDPSQEDIAAAAEDVLLLANAQGYAPCGHTRRQLGL